MNSNNLQVFYARTGAGGVQEAGEERAVVGGSKRLGNRRNRGKFRNGA